MQKTHLVANKRNLMLSEYMVIMVHLDNSMIVLVRGSALNFASCGGILSFLPKGCQHLRHEYRSLLKMQ